MTEKGRKHAPGAEGTGTVGKRIFAMIEPVCAWYRAHRRELPWRDTRDPYRIWVSEIMLQQTRVEAVKPYYARFLAALPDVETLAACPEDRLLKLWEGLGYYNRVRNMQRAAQVLLQRKQLRPADAGNEVADLHGKVIVPGGDVFPHTAAELRNLPGIGAYTSGAIASIAFDESVPAADGNVFRILARVLADEREIDRESVKREMTGQLETAMRAFWENAGAQQDRKRGGSARTEAVRRTDDTCKEAARPFVPGDFNQGLMDLGAAICLPNSTPHCADCPLACLCGAHTAGRETEFPVRTKKKERRVEKKTVLLIRDGDKVVLVKRPAKGLLAGLYEFPCLPAADSWADHAIGARGGQQAEGQHKRIISLVRDAGLEPLQVKRLESAKHVFSHVEWHMSAYEVRVSALESQRENGWILAEIGEIERNYPVPTAYAAYAEYLQLRLGPEGTVDSF